MPSRGRAAIVGVAVIALAMMSVSVDAGAAPATPKAKGTTLATLEIQASMVRIKPQGRSKYVAAKDGQVLHQGDAIQTDAAGHAEIDYTDGSLTRLSPSTSFTITQLTDKRGGRQTQGTLSVGDTWNRAAKVSETGSFKITAGDTTAAVEGTAFAFSCVRQRRHKTCTVIGVVDTVRVSTPGGGIVELGPGKLLVVTDDVPGPVQTLTYISLIKLPLIIDNLNLDQEAGKGGLFELAPLAPLTPPVLPGYAGN